MRLRHAALAVPAFVFGLMGAEVAYAACPGLNAQANLYASNRGYSVGGWVGCDAGGTIAPGMVLLDQNAQPFGVSGNPIYVTGSSGGGNAALETGGNLAAAATALGSTSGAAVTTDANGAIQQYLRGLVKQWTAGTLVLGAGTNLIGTVQSPISPVVTNPTSVLTRPADTTAYSQNDLIANNTTAGSVTVPSFAIATSGGGACIGRVRLTTNKTSGWDATTFTMRLWTAAPTYTNGDNAAYAVATGAAGFLASFSVTLSQFADGASGVGAPAVGNNVCPKLASGTSIYWDLQYTGSASLTPASGQTFTATPEVLN